MNNPKVNILVLNWNGEDILNKCIESILNSNYNNFSITIIDNGSTDTSLQKLITHDKISLIKIDKNLGYAKGYNFAFNKLKYISDDYYLLLNNDTIIDENTISSLIYSTEVYGYDNIYGPRILDQYSGKNWFCGGKINLINGMPFHLGINTSNLITSFKNSEVDYISGCCMLLSKQLVSKINGFNDVFNMYYEDVDLCLRARKIGSKCYFISSSSIKHFISYSTGGRYSLTKYFKKINSFIKFIFLHNNIIVFLLYCILNFLLFPIYLVYLISQRAK